MGQGSVKKFFEQILEREALLVADGLNLTTPEAKDTFSPIYNIQKIFILFQMGHLIFMSTLIGW